jgi:NADH-quinone oxidoreductase subunit J
VIQGAIFFLLSLLVLVPAILVVTVKNVFHAAIYLVLSLTGVAGLFAMLGADFLFVAQLLVYSGGIVVLLIFVVLLSGSPKDWIVRQVNGQWLISLLISACFVCLLAALFRFLPESAPKELQPTTASLGILLLRDMILPFEAVSLVLLAALMGAIFFTRKKEEV